MAVLPIRNVVNAGTAPAFLPATTSDVASIGSGDDTILVYKNSGVASVITILVPGQTSYGANNPTVTINLPATTGEIWIPLRKAFDDGTGNCTVALSSAAGVTVSLVRHQ